MRFQVTSNPHVVPIKKNNTVKDKPDIYKAINYVVIYNKESELWNVRKKGDV